MRKILYSPEYGAGWVSWHYGSKEQKLFMLEYPPFIAHLEAQTNLRSILRVVLDENHPLVEQFKKDWDEKFPEVAGDYPFFGGLRDLSVRPVEDGALVRINEYDGAETIEVLGDFQNWL